MTRVQWTADLVGEIFHLNDQINADLDDPDFGGERMPYLKKSAKTSADVDTSVAKPDASSSVLTDKKADGRGRNVADARSKNERALVGSKLNHQL